MNITGLHIDNYRCTDRYSRYKGDVYDSSTLMFQLVFPSGCSQMACAQVLVEILRKSHNDSA